MLKTYSSLHIERAIVAGFLSLITAGALLLWGFGLWYQNPVSLLDAFFTATSAVCVTGLTVTDTALMPLPSQATIMVLIQFGGLGAMTVMSGLLLFLRRRIGVKEGLYLAGGLNVSTHSGARALVLRVWTIALLVELTGAALLCGAFRRTMPAEEALWYALFHSVSAFCNAGFSLFSTNLLDFGRSLTVPFVIMTLIVVGGLGFLVLYELWRLPGERAKLSPHAALVLQMTGTLILAGAVLLFLAERNASLKGLPGPGWKFWNALFMSVTSRTAGFNTCPMNLSGEGVFLLVILMSIGASPGSTGGGLKTTTLGLMLISTFHHLRSQPQIVYRKRAVSRDNVLMALSLAMLYASVFLLGLFLLVECEPAAPFRALIFETASALGTVGLSMDLTPTLSSAGKCVVIVLMFLGRVGILTFAIGFLGRRVEADNVTYVETGISIG